MNIGFSQIKLMIVTNSFKASFKAFLTTNREILFDCSRSHHSSRRPWAFFFPTLLPASFHRISHPTRHKDLPSTSRRVARAARPAPRIARCCARTTIVGKAIFSAHRRNHPRLAAVLTSPNLPTSPLRQPQPNP